ncbi:MAG: type I phosphomannose isomerase catalytic subunit [Anaerolineae bacterium]
MTTSLYPLLLAPTLHVKVWGGRKLGEEWGKTLTEDAPYGESWELHDSSTVINGALQGQTLAQLIVQYGTALIGQGFDPSEGLPLLVKLLDATQWLSVQVHPNDEQARALEGDPRGKTEAWIILATDPDARLVIGVHPGTSQQAMADAIRDGTLEDLLEYATVQAGDVLYMPANTVHAIGPGIRLYEVQQSSNVTYRLYDWGRMGLDGQPRQLHVEKGVQVSNLDTLPDVAHPDDALMVDGAFFQTTRHTLNTSENLTLTADGAFHALTCIDGTASIEHDGVSYALAHGQTAMIPASLGEYALTGSATVLRSYLV